MLQGFTYDGEDARLWLCEEGERIGLLMFEWNKRVVIRRGDRSAVFTVHRRRALTSHARLSGEVSTTIERDGRRYVSPLGVMTQAATGVLTGMRGEAIVHETPIDGELIRLRFGLGTSPELRATMIGIALLYESDHRR